ncbi:hypothetical protein [Shewanella atlantica]|uniref:Uncharacterized protein n=1 Tax=Shewanella atlantica TaxID=271099 RepID=A0A431VZN2_9GAMM|nr:hypothetical protein [Shewanella atlantica]RTR28583.1 hypothetical protein EKG39_18810 [Shewanella atlantica]
MKECSPERESKPVCPVTEGLNERDSLEREDGLVRPVTAGLNERASPERESKLVCSVTEGLNERIGFTLTRCRVGLSTEESSET